MQRPDIEVYLRRTKQEGDVVIAPPNIRSLFLDIAGANGMVSRLEPSNLITDQVDKIIRQTPYMDVMMLETWLGLLTDEELQTLADGEHQEIAEIVAGSLVIDEETGKRVGDLVDEIWEQIR